MSSQHVWFRKHQDSDKIALPPLCVCTAITTYNSTPLPSSNYSVKKATTSWQSPNSRHWLAATDLSLLSLACHLCSKAESYLKQKQTPSLLYSMILTFSWQIFFKNISFWGSHQGLADEGATCITSVTLWPLVPVPVASLPDEQTVHFFCFLIKLP